MKKAKKDYDSSKTRCYWHSLIVYSEPSTFQPLLKKASHWAYAYHDKDVLENGSPKEPHYHILVHFSNARTLNSCKKDIHSTMNVFGEAVRSPVGAYEYLWHENDPDKYQYEKSIVIVHNPVYWEMFVPEIRDRTNLDFIEDLLDPSVDMLTMAKRYGRDYMKNWRSYDDFADEVRHRERYNLKK